MEKKFNNPGRTAITRKKLSKPMQYLKDNDMLHGRVLDYGAGRGFDMNELGIEGYDPNQEAINVIPEGKFDTITSNYVLNVVSEETGNAIIEDIRSRLNEGGVAYVSVRRDIKKDTDSQRVVHLDLPLVKEAKGSFAMYKVVG